MARQRNWALMVNFGATSPQSTTRDYFRHVTARSGSVLSLAPNTPDAPEGLTESTHHHEPSRRATEVPGSRCDASSAGAPHCRRDAERPAPECWASSLPRGRTLRGRAQPSIESPCRRGVAAPLPLSYPGYEGPASASAAAWPRPPRQCLRCGGQAELSLDRVLPDNPPQPARARGR